jgi:hypothetical protein
MKTSMTVKAHDDKIVQHVILPIPINVMYFKFNVFSRARDTLVRKSLKSISLVKTISVLIIRVILSSLHSLQSLAILSRKPLILTLSTTICSLFGISRRKVNSLSTVFADYRNLVFSIVVMKASSTTKKLSSILSRLNNKLFSTLKTVGLGFRMPILLSAFNRAKDLFTRVSFKYSIAVRACFIHAITIPR